jgi:hypothetical protein
MKILRMLTAMLREIFDEAAFERFCRRERIEQNRKSYARFLRDANADSKPEVRCC